MLESSKRVYELTHSSLKFVLFLVDIPQFTHYSLIDSISFSQCLLQHTMLLLYLLYKSFKSVGYRLRNATAETNYIQPRIYRYSKLLSSIILHLWKEILSLPIFTSVCYSWTMYIFPSLKTEKWYLFVTLICIFLISSETEHFFMCLLATCASSSMNCLFISFFYFSTWLFSFTFWFVASKVCFEY